jgi:urease accessory protein
MTRNRRLDQGHVAKTTALAAIVLVAGLSAASAHEGAGVAGGFLSGFTHPMFGWDHVAAMVAVGLWGAFLGPPAIWIFADRVSAGYGVRRRAWH